MPRPKPQPVAVTKDGATMPVEPRAGEGAVVVFHGLLQFRLDPAQARVLARSLRRAAAVLDPDPEE